MLAPVCIQNQCLSNIDDFDEFRSCCFELFYGIVLQFPRCHPGHILHPDSSSTSKCQRHPASDQAESTQRRYWAQELETFPIQDQQIDAARKHGHSSSEEALGPDVLRCGLLSNKKGNGVNELEFEVSPFEIMSVKTKMKYLT